MSLPILQKSKIEFVEEQGNDIRVKTRRVKFIGDASHVNFNNM